MSPFKTLTVLLLIWVLGCAFHVDLTKETVDNLILQQDGRWGGLFLFLENADICPWVKTKWPESSVFNRKPPIIEGAPSPGLTKRRDRSSTRVSKLVVPLSAQDQEMCVFTVAYTHIFISVSISLYILKYEFTLILLAPV